MDMEKLVSSVLWGIGLVVFGGLLLLDALIPDFTFDFGKWWPLIIVFAGINVLTSGVIEALRKGDK